MSNHAEFNRALEAEAPLDALRSVVQGLVSRGDARDSVLAELEELRRTLQAAGKEKEEDVVLEVMDFLVGWCSPHMRI